MKNSAKLISLFALLFCTNIFSQQINNNQIKSFDASKVDLERMREATTQEFSRINQLKLQMTDAQKKLSTDLLHLVNNNFLPLATSIEAHSNTMVKFNQFKPFEFANDIQTQVLEGQVYVYVYLNDGYSTSIVNTFAENVTNRDEQNYLAVAWIKVKNLDALASLTGVRKIRTVIPPVKRIGSALTEGDAIHRTLDVRNIYGEDGTGISIGVISDGVTNRFTAQLNGDLPVGNQLTVLSVGSGDEGTAMLEIIYDMVPGANLFFHDAGANTADFNTAIDNLITAGCDIICDDIGWLLEPFYEDGTVASHVSSVIGANDIIYVSACGNAGNSHYQGDFYPLAAYPDFHDFSEGSDPTYTDLYVSIPIGEDVIVVLQWDDQFGASGNDYDVVLYSFDLDSVVAGSTIEQNGDDDPLEAFLFTANSSGASDAYAIWVNKFSGDDRNLEVFIYPSWFNYIDNIKPEDAIFGHAAANGVVSVGACDEDTPDSLEIFSSWGPSTIEFPTSEIRQTPSIVGVDFVEVSGAGGFPTSFGGTSAATPHIVAVLAQAWSYDIMQTGDDVRTIII